MGNKNPILRIWGTKNRNNSKGTSGKVPKLKQKGREENCQSKVARVKRQRGKRVPNYSRTRQPKVKGRN